MSGTIHVMTLHHNPEHLKLQQHQYGESQMSKLFLGKNEELKNQNTFQPIYLKQVFPCTRETFYHSLKIHTAYELQHTSDTNELVTNPNEIAKYVSIDTTTLIRVKIIYNLW